MTAAAIELASAVVEQGARRILDGVSLRIAPGEIVALAGPSGAGKSTLLRAVLGFVPPSSGAIRLRGETVSADGKVLVPPEERGLAVVFQDLALWPHLSVAGNLAFVLEARGVARRLHAQRIDAMLDDVGLAGFGRRAVGALSGGERQRVAIARALVTTPDIVLFDEPLASLDVQLARDLLALIARLLRTSGAAAIYITHDCREAAVIADRVAVLEASRLSQEGTPADLRASPATPFVRAFSDDLR